MTSSGSSDSETLHRSLASMKASKTSVVTAVRDGMSTVSPGSWSGPISAATDSPMKIRPLALPPRLPRPMRVNGAAADSGVRSKLGTSRVAIRPSAIRP